MGMEYSAKFADVVEDDFVRKTVGELAYDSFIKELESLDLSEAIDALVYGDPPNDETEKVYLKCETICSDMKRLTGLDIDLDYHSADDNGGIYDGVNEWFWYASNVYQLSKVGVKNASHFSRKFYVIYGR